RGPKARLCAEREGVGADGRGHARRRRGRPARRPQDGEAADDTRAVPDVSAWSGTARDVRGVSCRAPALVALAFALPLGAAAEEAITCPAGAALIQMSNARGREQWCERPGPPPVRHGPYLLFHANGTVRVRGLNRDSVPDGDWRSWHPDGTPSGEVTFVAGKPTGMLLGWYPNGKASFVGGFRDGVAIGVFEIFDAEGRLRMSVDYGAD